MRRRFLVTLLGMVAIAALSGCSNNPTSTSFGTMNIQMTDAPGDFQAVNLVVREVAVQHADGNGGWEVLQSGTRTYDLLQLRNGVFATLGISKLPAGRYDNLRMKLGQGSNVVVNGVTHPLMVGNEHRNGLILSGEFKVPKQGRIDLAIDFNVARSIRPAGDGSYWLKPCLRVVVISVPENRPGAIKGQVLPADAAASVFVLVNADTVAGSMATADGSFMVSVLPAGTYRLVFHSSHNYLDLSVSDVVVKAGLTTDIGPVTMQPVPPPPPPPPPTKGTLSGMVAPAGVPTTVSVMQGSTLVASTDADMGGNFAVGQLPEGTYSLVFHPVADYLDATLEGVVVTAGMNTDVGVVTLSVIPPPPPPPPPPAPGAIAGQVMPGGLPTTVFAMQGDVIVAQVSAAGNGSFLIDQLPVGTYTVVVHPLYDYLDSTFANVVVNSGATTNLGPIQLTY